MPAGPLGGRNRTTCNLAHAPCQIEPLREVTLRIRSVRPPLKSESLQRHGIRHIDSDNTLPRNGLLYLTRVSVRTVARKRPLPGF